VDEIDIFPAASPTRPDVAQGFSREAAGPRVIAAEWALWGKEAHETGYHVLRCSRGALSEKDFSEAVTRYSPGEIEGLPHYTVSWIPGANREPEYIALGVHELASADPRQAGGRSRVDAVGREIVFIRLFCLRYADLAEHVVTYRDQALGYQDLIQAVAGIRPPAGATELARVTLPAEPLPIIKRGAIRKQAEQVAAVLLTGRQVCVLGGYDIPVTERLRFIDTVMAMLPYGMRATMSAATWASSTSQELKLRLFFASGRRTGGRLAIGGRARAEDLLMEWGKLDQIDISDQAARLYQLWLDDVKNEAPAMLAHQVDPVRFAPADVRHMVGNLPRDKSVLATLDDLARAFGVAVLDQGVITDSTRRLQRYLAGEDQPADNAEVQREYRRRVCRYRLLADNGLPPRPKDELYDQLLRVAFGPALTYTGYRDIEESAGAPLHPPLRSALARFEMSGWLAFILARTPPAGFRGGDGPTGTGGIPAGEPIEELIAGVRSRTVTPAHARGVLDWVLHDLPQSSVNPGAPLAEHAYLVSACEYAHPNDPGAQVRQLQRVLSIAFDSRRGRLGRPEIDTIFTYLNSPPLPALGEAITSMTTSRNSDYVRKKIFEAFLPRQEVPGWAVYSKRDPRWRGWLPWPSALRERGPAVPPWPGAFGATAGPPSRVPRGNPWAHPKTLSFLAVFSLVVLFAVYFVFLYFLWHH
jgi:hypothetical protein